MMVDEDIKIMYDSVITYLTAKQAYYSDPTTPDSEFGDLEPFDLATATDTIQRQIRNMPTFGEGAVIKGYRDIRAATAEYEIRNMTRADYWADAAVEEQDNIDKWKFNKTTTFLHMNGKDAGN